MKAIVCELCEGRDFAKIDGMFVCQSCGAKYTPEDAKNLMKEVEGEAPAAAAASAKGTVGSELDKYLTLARRAKDSDNSADAAKYYGMAQAEDPNSWECLFYSTYFTAMQTNIAGIASAAYLVRNCLESVIDLIINHTPKDDQHNAVTDVATHCIAISNMLFNAATSHYNGIGDSIRSNYTGEYRQRASACVSITETLGNIIANNFGDDPDYNVLVAESWKNGFNLMENNGFAFNYAEVSIENLEAIANFDKEYARTKVNAKINAINNSITNLSNTKESNGCLAGLCGVISLIFVILEFIMGEGMFLFFGFGMAFVLVTVICAIPKPKSAAKKAKDQEAIARLTKNKERLENIIK